MNHGLFEKAEAADLKCLELSREVLGEKHPEIIEAMSSLAVTHRKLGRNIDAEALQLEVLQLCKELLGDMNPRPSIVLAT